MLRLALLTLTAAFAFASTATAEPPKRHPEVINWSDKAFAWPKRRGEKDYKYKDGDPIYVYDAVAALDGQTLVDADCTKWSAEHKAVTWCFANEANLAKFKKSIDKDSKETTYEPLFGGRCALGTSWGYPAPTGDPRTFEVVEYRGEHRLLLQSHNRWRAEWRAKEEINLGKAELAYNIFQAVGTIVPNADLKKGQ